MGLVKLVYRSFAQYTWVRCLNSAAYPKGGGNYKSGAIRTRNAESIASFLAHSTMYIRYSWNSRENRWKLPARKGMESRGA